MKYKKIGVICAMEKEARKIIDCLSDKAEETVGSIAFYRGKIGEKEAIVAICGIGKVFAAICAQTMILHYAPDCILNSGVAGSLSESLEILDIAVSENLVQHDMDTSPLGDPEGLISGINLVYLPAEEELKNEVLKTAKKLGFSALAGTIASGDQFIARKEQKDRIIKTFSPIACEMEGAAIAQVAYVEKVPFCAIRAISDSFAGKNEMDYALFAEEAANRGAKLLLSLLNEE